jgi:hypothetical protein
MGGVGGILRRELSGWSTLRVLGEVTPLSLGMGGYLYVAYGH